MIELRTSYLTRCLVTLGLVALSGRISAQAIDTALRPSEIAVTGGYIYGDPAYGPGNLQGISVGAMFTRYFHFPVAPSLEVRGNLANTPYNKETTYLGGLRVQAQVLHRLHPYADFMAGGGVITFKFPDPANYTSDNSVVYDYGGGLGIDILSNIQLTGDYQHQSWNLGTEHANNSDKFHPILYTFGVKYTIPFKSFVGSTRHSAYDKQDQPEKKK